MEETTKIEPVESGVGGGPVAVLEERPAYGTPEWHKWRLARSAAAQYGNPIPKDVDWLSLPVDATLAAEVEWVHRNYAYVVKETAAGKPKMMWANMVSDPPSQGSRGLMEWAAENRTAFYKDLMPKIRLGGVDDEGKRRHDKKLVEEIERALEQLEAE